jgi:hypothetical protein
MFRKITLIAAAVATTAALFAGPASAATTSKVTIKHLGGGEFTGKVKSADPDCIAERTVILYEMNGSKPKPKNDRKIVKDTTDEDGRWNTGQTGEKSGDFYAKVKRTDDCRKALSKVISI